LQVGQKIQHGKEKKENVMNERKLWEEINLWLNRRKLVGDTRGSIYYISYKDIGELYDKLFGRGESKC
jgi:hypothetical protein